MGRGTTIQFCLGHPFVQQQPCPCISESSTRCLCVCGVQSFLEGAFAGLSGARDTPLFDIDTHSPQPRRVYNQSSAEAQKSPGGGASTNRALQKRRKAHGWRASTNRALQKPESPRLEERLRAELCRRAEKPKLEEQPAASRASAMLLRPNFTSTQCNTYASLLRKICTIHEQRPSWLKPLVNWHYSSCNVCALTAHKFTKHSWRNVGCFCYACNPNYIYMHAWLILSKLDLMLRYVYKFPAAGID